MKKLCLVIIFSLIALLSFSDSVNWSDDVIYMVMIDRFANGNSFNDIQTESGIEYGNENSKYNGGDLQGLIDKLDYIKDLGVTAIWVTPPIANQWWDGDSQYGGYHGYWARDFKNIDEHFGDNDLYKKFVDAAHEKGLKVIQDIVTNHVGNYFKYENGSYSLVTDTEPKDKPIQYPFNQIDYNDPSQREAEIYHFPSEIKNPDVYNTAFGVLEDLNTENPVVIDALKDSHGFWINYAGIDGFRIDTAIYVPLTFWNDFLNGKNGIIQQAEAAGKNNFLIFGEAWYTPEPFTDSAEKNISSYFDNGYNSMLDFALYTDIKRVFKEGKATSYLKYRLDERAKYYNPENMVTFIDNHDTDRFLKGSSSYDLKQALTFIFTIPGIPTVYYGTEQKFTETRTAMFSGGFESQGENHYGEDGEIYKFLQDLTELRKNTSAFRHGKTEVLYSDDLGPGPFVYKIYDDTESYIVVMNTFGKKKYATDIDLNLPEGTVLKSVFSSGAIDKDITYEGKLNMLLNAKSLIIYKITDETKTFRKNNLSVSIDNIVSGETFSDNFIVSGTANNAKNIKLIIDGDEKAHSETSLNMKENEKWSLNVNISDFTPGEHNIFVKITGKLPIYSEYSKTFKINMEIPLVTIADVQDKLGDDNGLSGKYGYPKDLSFSHQEDIENLRIDQIGTMIKMTFRMKELTDSWAPSNGFDHVTFQIFFNNPEKTGVTDLPLQNAKMYNGTDWDYQFYINGWGSSAFNSNGASALKYGEAVVPSPLIKVDKILREITMIFPLSILDTDSLKNWDVYVTTYDYDGIEAVLRPISAEGAQWSFSGGTPSSPKIMDDLFFTIK